MNIIKWNELLLPYEQAVKELKLKLEIYARQFREANNNCPIDLVEGRVKSVGSILAKMNKKNIPFEEIEEKVEDIAGIRIICRFVEDIEKIVNLLKDREDFDMKIILEKDYISNIKQSGYRAYHLIVMYPVMTWSGRRDVKAEIQIRTMSMNFWSTIEHSLRYKYSGNIPDDVQKRLNSSAEAAFMLDKEMSTIRDEITEAQKIMLIVNKTVDEILSTLQNLYSVVNIEKVNDLNRQFIEIYQTQNLDRLLEFAEQLRVIGDLYKIRYTKS